MRTIMDDVSGLIVVDTISDPVTMENISATEQNMFPSLNPDPYTSTTKYLSGNMVMCSKNQ